MPIIQSEYPVILAQIQGLIAASHSKIAQEKVLMAWKIGEEIHKHLPSNNQDAYGKKLIQSLEADIGISKDVLYKMRSFYTLYPNIEQLSNAQNTLNWSHYKSLLGIRDPAKRQHLEKMVCEKGWSQRDLQAEIQIIKKEENQNQLLPEKPIANQSITPNRGVLFAYQITQIPTSSDYFLDCGFGISRKIIQTLPASLKQEGSIVTTSKKDETYLINPLTISTRQLHTYKAHLNKVVDGDTLRVDLDLGFGIFHHEILRLAKINAPEKNTPQGKKSTATLTKLVSGAPFLVIKSLKTDIYGRYVADIFLASKQMTNPQQVADEGVYLNQLLLDEGVAEMY